MMSATMNWLGGMQFETNNRGLVTQIDATTDHGGKNLAPTPKELVMNAMMGCTAMDVVSTLQKMRQTIERYTMSIEVEKNKEYPIYFTRANLTFHLFGNIDSDKLIKAVDSSLTKYCGVNYMISKVCEITYDLYLNEKKIKSGKTAFTDPLA
jgi:putative redox protein